MDRLWQDLRHGIRTLGRSPGFAFVAIATLALGIGANSAVFSVINAFLWRPLPFERPEELVHVWQTDRQLGASELRVSVPNFLDWKQSTEVFQDLGGYFYQSYNVSTDEAPVRIQVGRVSTNLLDLLGVEPVVGRRLLAHEDRSGDDRVVILSHGFWQRHFAGDSNVLGRTVMLDGNPYVVVGVMPPEFVFPLEATQMWTPLSLDPWEGRREMNGPLLVVGRLAPGVTRLQAQTELAELMARLAQEYPEANRGRGVNVVPLRQALVFFYDMLRVSFYSLLLAVMFVLLIVCANLGNLLLARATGRRREIAVRLALGSGRRRLVRQLLTESALLAALGGGLGVALARWFVAVTGPLIPPDLYRAGRIEIDGWALVFTFAVALVAAVLFGLAPALRSTRLDLNQVLKAGGLASGGDPAGRQLRSFLVVAQVALAVVLLTGSGLMVQSLLRLRTVETGFNPHGVLTMELDLSESKYPGDSEENGFYEEVLDRTRALPEVESAATSYPLPLNFESIGVGFVVEGREPVEADEKLSASLFWVSTDYFGTLEIPLRHGRAFSRLDNTESAPVVIINRRMAERFWSDEDAALGARLRLRPGTEQELLATVVGIVSDSKHFLLNEEPTSLVYRPQLQRSTRRRFLTLRTSGDPLSMVSSVRRQIWAVDPNLPITTIRSMEKVVEESLAPWTGGTVVLAGLGLGALLLSVLGIYGVISFGVRQRTHEIGVRVALGARGRDIVGLMVRQGLALAAVGVGIGLLLAAALTHALQVLLYGVEALDPLTFVGTPLLLLSVASLASYLPARRATRVDPVRTLRYE